ncbi:glycoside hydrolase family 5 protein [Leadbetterella sp. DM7]|uniref:glycoside hydrolase family 5 protein n=1 Tax=Leadbetterella sp. DM7 TaxID=3235085 RepID=UPI00349E7936
MANYLKPTGDDKHMPAGFFLLLIFSLLCLFLPAQAQHSRLVAGEGNVYFENGQPARLRGISFSWSIWGGAKYYNPAIVDELADAFKCNVIRVSMAVEPADGYLRDPELQWNRITPVIDRALERGIYVIMDWHDHHADKNVKEAMTFFDRFSARYASSPLIIYEIWNEPERIDWKIVKAYAERLIPVIRKNDPGNLIVVGSSSWDQDIDIVAKDRLTGFDNIAYSFHFYASEPHHQENLRNRATTAIEAGLPVFVTEWGVGEANGDGAFDPEKNKAWMTWMEKHQLSWVNWNLTDKKETTALLKPGAPVNGSWKKSNLSPSGLYVRQHLRRLNR